MNGTWKEVFASGTWTDSSGRTQSFSEADLDKIISKYNTRITQSPVDMAPITVGHPKTDTAPAYGWVSALKRDGTKLLAQFKDVVSDFADLVKQKVYKNTSIGITGDLDLRHIAFLGGVPPAVKGLSDIAFNSGVQTFEYAIDQPENPPQKGNNESETKQGNNMNFDELKKQMREAIRSNYTDEVAAKFDALIAKLVKGEYADQDKLIADLQKKVSELEKAENKEANPEFSALQNQFEAMKKQNELLANQNKDMLYSQYFDGLIAKGKMTPAQKASFKIVFDSMVTSDFSESADGMKKLNDYVNTLPDQNLLKEFASKDNYTDEDKQRDELIAKQAKMV